MPTGAFAPTSFSDFSEDNLALSAFTVDQIEGQSRNKTEGQATTSEAQETNQLLGLS